MLRGLYTSVSGMINQQRKHDIATNNLANIETPGFKQGVGVSRAFPEVLVSLMNGSSERPEQRIGRLNTGVLPEETIFPMLQGDLQETGNPLDVALLGEQLFFTILNGNDETRYTRSGKFAVDGEGQLTTASGERVLGTNGEPIVLNIDSQQLLINEQGQLIDALTHEALLGADGAPLALAISQINQPEQLVMEGYGSFRLENAEENPAEPLVDPLQGQIRQGYIERSNVDPTASMTQMMTALRLYQANQQVVQAYDSTLDKAVNEIGRV